MEIKGQFGGLEAPSEGQISRSHELALLFEEMGLELIEVYLGSNEYYYVRCKSTGERFRFAANGSRIDGGWLEITKIKGKL